MSKCVRNRPIVQGGAGMDRRLGDGETLDLIDMPIELQRLVNPKLAKSKCTNGGDEVSCDDVWLVEFVDECPELDCPDLCDDEHSVTIFVEKN